MKNEKTTLVFFLVKYRIFWSISSEFKLERNTCILELWIFANIGQKMKKSLIQFAFTNPFFGLITYILYPIISLRINILPLIQKLNFLHFLSKLFLFLTKILFLKNIKINFQYTYWEKMHTKKCGLPNKQTFHLINVVSTLIIAF